MLKAVGGKSLEKALDVLGGSLEKAIGSGKGMLTLPDDITPVLPGTTADQYVPTSSFDLAARRCTIKFDDLVNSGPGDGLKGTIALEWLEAHYAGPVAARTRAERQQIRSVLFFKSISGMGSISAGGAIASAEVTISISSPGVDSKVTPPRSVALAVVKISVEPKTPLGDTVDGVLRLALNPQDPVNWKIKYDEATRLFSAEPFSA